MELAKLREQAADIVRRMQELADTLIDPESGEETRGFSDEEQSTWDDLAKQHDAAVERLRRHEALEGRKQATGDAIERATPTPSGRQIEPGRQTMEMEEARALSIQAWFRAGSRDGPDLTDKHRRACEQLGVNPESRTYDFKMLGDEHAAYMRQVAAASHPSIISRALSTIVGASGGVLVPPGFHTQLEMNRLAVGGFIPAVSTIRTDGGADYPMPMMDDTTQEGEMVAEAGTVTTGDPATDALVMKAHKWSSKEILISSELENDAATNLASVVSTLVGQRLGRKQNTDCTTGLGVTTARGIVTAATLGATTTSATAIIYDELIELLHSVDPAYRTGASWMMHDSVIQHLRLIKDGDGRPIWQDGLQTGVPDRLLGYPVVTNQAMASSVAASAKVILFGPLSMYKLRMVQDIRLKRLDELHALSDQVGFVAFSRWDGALMDPGTHPIKYLQMHA